MGRSSKNKRRRPPQGSHLKYVGIGSKTLIRYRTQVARFFHYLEVLQKPFPDTTKELDLELSEYINHLWLDGGSHCCARALVSGLHRFVPRLRGRLATSRQCLRNWERTLVRKRAFPLPRNCVIAFAGVAYAYKRLDLSAILLTGFLCMLRTMEAVTLQVHQIIFFPGVDKAIISLPDSKGSHRKNVTEQVVVEDPLVLASLALACRGKKPSDCVYEAAPRNFSGELQWLARALGVFRTDLTPYTLRRGGATFHYLRYGNLSVTTSFGRWENEKTCKIYVQQGAVHLAEWSTNEAQRALIHRAMSVCVRVLQEARLANSKITSIRKNAAS